MPLLYGKKIKLINEHNFICVRPLAKLQKSQDCFQISAHVSLISGMFGGTQF